MQKILIICYHRINDNMNSYLRPTTVKDFKRQMQYLSRVYNPVSLEEIAQHIRYGNPLPSKPVAITFDDGYRDNCQNAYPILRKYNIPATVFLTTGYIDNNKIPWWDIVYSVLSKTKKDLPRCRIFGESKQDSPSNRKLISMAIRKLKQLDDKQMRSAISDLLDQSNIYIDGLRSGDSMLSWKEVREMSNNGISFGAHTITHPSLVKIPEKQVKEEIYLPKKIIEHYTEKRVLSFAYPSGDSNVSICKMVKDAGYALSVSIACGYNTKNTNIYALRRNVIGFSGRIGSFLPIYRTEVTGALARFRMFYLRMRGR